MGRGTGRGARLTFHRLSLRTGISHWCSFIYGVMTFSALWADRLFAAQIAWGNQPWPWPSGPKSTGHSTENRDEPLPAHRKSLSSKSISGDADRLKTCAAHRRRFGSEMTQAGDLGPRPALSNWVILLPHAIELYGHGPDRHFAGAGGAGEVAPGAQIAGFLQHATADPLQCQAVPGDR